MKMPVCPDAAWFPKFQGPGNDLKYGDWKKQTHGLFGAQELNEARKN